MTDRFDELTAAAKADPKAFWAEAAEDITWIEPYSRILNDDNPPFYRWFEGGKVILVGLPTA